MKKQIRMITYLRLSSSKVLLVSIMTITAVILPPMRWIISMWKIRMSSPIVHGNLNISENRKCGEISLQELRKSPMIWNCNHLRVDNMLLQISCSKINSFQKGVWKSKLPYAFLYSALQLV